VALIDLHCHLDLHEDPFATADEAAAAGMYVLSVTTTPSAFKGTRRLERPGSRIRTALGLHPELAESRRRELPLFRSLICETAYVGEVGLDGSRAHRGSLKVQTEVLSEILSICAEAGGRVISLHSRGAAAALLDLLEAEPRAGRSVLHWFSATPSLVDRASRLGCWFSVGSQMLGSRTGRSAFEAMPAHRILPETDGPFGTVAGRPARPTDVTAAYDMIGQFLGQDRDAVVAMMTRNLRTLLPSQPVVTPEAAA